MSASLATHWRRLKKSLGKRLREWQLPEGYIRLGTRYGGWWVDQNSIGKDPLLVDCGLGEDISFPSAFLARFGGKVVGIEPNPRSLAFCREHCPSDMEVWPQALWTTADETLSFHLPRPQEQLPKGADGVSGSLVDTHEYVAGGDKLVVKTTSLDAILSACGRQECDVLKLDIEGAEYDVLTQLASSGTLRKARQVLVEFHHGVTHHTLTETETVIDKLAQAGFNLVHTEGRNYIFLRNDLV